LPLFGVNCDKFVTKTQAPNTPSGVLPYFVILIEKQSSEKFLLLGAGKIYYFIFSPLGIKNSSVIKKLSTSMKHKYK